MTTPVVSENTSHTSANNGDDFGIKITSMDSFALTYSDMLEWENEVYVDGIDLGDSRYL